MRKKGEHIALKREGTTQKRRTSEAPSPDSILLNDLDLKGWMLFAYNFAEQINFFDTHNTIPKGNWKEFFKSKHEISEFLKQVDSGGDVPPHLALFVTFLKLLELPQKRLNQIPKRHLDFYYEKVLQIKKLPSKPDEVYLLFELAKKAVEEFIPAGTELEAGKDALGKPLVYKTVEDFNLTRVTVEELRSAYSDNVLLKKAPVSASYDGKGADFPDDKIGWWPFGHPGLEEAKVGFTLASSVLEMQEGERTITIEVEIEDALHLDDFPSEALQIWFTGEKGWLGSYTPTGITKRKNRFTIDCTIPVEEEAITSYNQAIHEGNYHTTDPLCRIYFDTKDSSQVESLFGKTVKNIKISVEVKGLTNLLLENDQGLLNPDSAFYPFGTQPKKGSSLNISFPELEKKKFEKLRVVFNWRNVPEGEEGFKNLYWAYRNGFLPENSPDDVSNPFADSSNLIVENNTHFTAKIELKRNKEWVVLKKKGSENEESDEWPLFNEENIEDFFLEFEIENPSIDPDSKIRISLNQSFYHELVPAIYSYLMKDPDNKIILHEPYTPLAKDIRLGYSAFASTDFGTEEEVFQESEVRLFNEYPFGQAEVYPWKRGQNNETAKNIVLLPSNYENGELYIGLQDALPRQTASLLIQLIEGTENPESEKGNVDWSVLIQNEWRLLDSNYLIKDETHNFLKTGIVQFSIPKEANTDNTLLPEGLIWIKAQLTGDYDSVCRCYSIDAQAIRAQFENNQNDEAHLETGMAPDSITKLRKRKSTVKSISQPYSSFGGKPGESDKDYYLRVSERLRHKNRAVTLWDYEHLVLQEFPQLHKVRCLNHTSENSFLAPGNVYLVVVPDFVNQHVFDIYQPRVSKALLEEIENFLKKIKGPMVEVHVKNPIYEEVKVKCKVKFREGFDAHYHLKKIKEDVSHFISPWVKKSEAELKFSKSIHKSEIIYFLENLEYVDYLTEVSLFKKVGDQLMEYQNVEPENPKAVLCSVSPEDHDIG